MTFQELLYKVRGDSYSPPECLLGLDPGETIGWALFKNGKMIRQGQKVAKGNMCQAITELLDEMQPTHIICEDYRVYAHKSEIHINQELFTPKLIGMIHLLCFQRNIHIEYQMAQTAKGFCTDKKLKEWGYYIKGQRHSRDSIRHICYYLLFNYRRG